MSSHKYVPHCERFELKLGMHGEEGLLTNFIKFHRDFATCTMFPTLKSLAILINECEYVRRLILDSCGWIRNYMGQLTYVRRCFYFDQKQV